MMGFFNKLWNFIRLKGFRDRDNVEQRLKSAQGQEEPVQQQYTGPVTPDTGGSEVAYEQQPAKETQADRQDKPAVTEMDRYVSRVSKFPKKSDVEKNIDNEQMVTGEVKSGTLNLNEFNQNYKDVFSQKVLKDGVMDDALFNVLLQNRFQLKHRFQVHFQVYIDNVNSSTLSIRGLLPEESQYIYSKINIGNNVEYLSKVLRELESSFESIYGSIGEGFTHPKKEKGKITDIKISYDFV